MKRSFAITLFLALCISMAVPTPTLALDYEVDEYTPLSSRDYTDVHWDHWAYQSIVICSNRNWFNGYPDGTFRPDRLIAREEAAKVFAEVLGLRLEQDPAVSYNDTESNWAKAYIEATKPLFPDVTTFQETTSFRPTQAITREEVVYALVMAWGDSSKAKNADQSVLNKYSDHASISAGVRPYMATAVDEGLVFGLPDGTIAPRKGLTRAEFATLLARALNHGYGKDCPYASCQEERYTIQHIPELDGKRTGQVLFTPWGMDADECIASTFAVEREDTHQRLMTFTINAPWPMHNDDIRIASQTATDTVFMFTGDAGECDAAHYNARSNTVELLPEGEYKRTGNYLICKGTSGAAPESLPLSIYSLDGKQLEVLTINGIETVYCLDGTTVYYAYGNDLPKREIEIWSFDLSSMTRERISTVRGEYPKEIAPGILTYVSMYYTSDGNAEYQTIQASY